MPGSGPRQLPCALLVLAGMAAMLWPVKPCRLAAATGAVDTFPAAQATGTPEFAFWNPSESHPGGSQYDVRLDIPVKFWHTGLSLTELFDRVREQTGVIIASHPPGDQNERIRVNVYLNPAHPPSLRELMAQLTWVVGCNFAYAAGDGDGSDWRYYLLWTSSGRGVVQQLAQENEQRNQESAEASAIQRKENQQAAKAKLAELAQALELTQQDLIRWYRGSDDFMLLTALDPARRELAAFACDQLADKEYLWDYDSSFGPEATFAWQDLPADERSVMEQALGFSADAIVGSDQICIIMGGMTEGCVKIRAMAHYVEGGPLKGRNYWHVAGSELTLIDARAGSGMTPQDSVALLQLLGTPLDSGEARKTIKGEWERSRQDETNRLRERVSKEVASHMVLSPAVETLLAGTVLPIEGEASYPLWRVQEMVAEMCGMSIVSDCFWQDARRLDWDISVANPGWGGNANALQALQASCQPASALNERLRLYKRDEESRVVRWEWGSAGSFLHFRSLDRDIWRGSMIPPDVLAEVDSVLAVELAEWLDFSPPTAVWQHGIDESTFLELVAIASKLDDLQLVYGRHLAYEDPASADGSRRLSLRRSLLGLAADNLETIRLLASLSRTQWQHATEGGLLVRDMGEPQVSLVSDVLRALHVTMRDESLRRTRLTVERGAASAQTGIGSCPLSLRLWHSDRLIASWEAPSKLTARLEAAPEPERAAAARPSANASAGR